MDLTHIFSKMENRRAKVLGKEHFQTYGILVPLLIKNNEIHILFEVRSEELRSQPGEICFPGGRFEKNDQTVKETAIRETAEELRINQKHITQVYPLDYLIQSMERRMIFPFVGLIHTDKISPNPAEVKEIFTVPLEYFRQMEPEIYPLKFQIAQNEQFPFHLIPGGKNYPFRTRAIKEYFYMYENYCIWGLTAKILNHFLSIVFDKN
ncbi:CoA pyrophosphatase [Caldibacillus thermolactis]|jgi:peroxisomal coenzyme A diphosphatase NUDT7|uniref:CoA pyrophosphatase n=1 Tax=Pallidibacillus thermolactis TaxID=251051 RepID=A0ABT2WHB2_9BACI|nr:CoA pyrophosphatase [Pallidibacillus thermolactis]MCU9595069.1 CoA pyrophosphatase [Pallidibacillus thermolactis]